MKNFEIKIKWDSREQVLVKDVKEIFGFFLYFEAMLQLGNAWNLFV